MLLLGVTSVVLAVAIVGCTSNNQQPPSQQPPDQLTFDSPQAAADALVSALRAHDTAQLKKVFGPSGDEIISSGDPVADRAERDRFLAAYDEQHRLQTDDASGRTTLIVGKNDFPFPAPIVAAADATGKYVFDTDAGEDEILNRRIGRNELATLNVCLAIIDAQQDYVAMRPTGSTLPEYAAKIISDPGTKNGLYWPTKEGEPDSPLGELVANAADEGYRSTTHAANEASTPFHGYRYRLLTKQGEHAKGGAMDYSIDGHLIGGFAVVAYPAQYGNSGIMTFITNHDGVVYQRDLGPDSQKIADAMTGFDPGPGWTKVTPPAADTADSTDDATTAATTAATGN